MLLHRAAWPQLDLRSSCAGESSSDVAARAHALAEAALAECTDPDLSRAAAELFGVAGSIGGDGFAVQLLRALQTAAAEATSMPRCAD